MKLPRYRHLRDLGRIHSTLEVPGANLPFQYVVMALRKSQQWVDENRLYFVREDQRIPGRSYSKTDYLSRITEVSQQSRQAFSSGTMLTATTPPGDTYRGYSTHTYFLRSVTVFESGAVLLVVTGDRSPVPQAVKNKLRNYLERVGKI